MSCASLRIFALMSASTRSCAREMAAPPTRQGQTIRRQSPTFYASCRLLKNGASDYTCSVTLPLVMADSHPHARAGDAGAHGAGVPFVRSFGDIHGEHDERRSRRRRRRRWPAIASSRSIRTTGRPSPRACSMSMACSTRAPGRTGSRGSARSSSRPAKSSSTSRSTRSTSARASPSGATRSSS